jgi:hypothetical protein
MVQRAARATPSSSRARSAIVWCRDTCPGCAKCHSNKFLVTYALQALVWVNKLSRSYVFFGSIEQFSLSIVRILWLLATSIRPTFGLWNSTPSPFAWLITSYQLQYWLPSAVAIISQAVKTPECCLLPQFSAVCSTSVSHPVTSTSCHEDTDTWNLLVPRWVVEKVYIYNIYIVISKELTLL